MAPRKKTKLSNNCHGDAPRNNALSKTPKNTRRTRRGCLEIVQTLPLDVSFEIFGLLHSKDLLNLAKTSKAFRSFFLNRANSISIWKASFHQVSGLPDKPEFLSEPAFAHLLFSPFCRKCGKPGVHNPIWPWFVRYCNACIADSSIQKRCPYNQYPDRQLELVVREHGMNIFDVYWINGGGDYIHKPQLDRFMEQWQNTNGDEDQRKALLEQARVATEESWKVCGSEGFRRSWFVSALMSGSPRWTTSEMSWPRVRTAIQGEMNAIRARRLQEERETQIEGRLHELAEAILDHYVQLPKTASMDCRPTLHILLGEEECCRLVIAPRDQEVTRRDFAEILPEVCTRWRVSCAEELRSLVRGAMPAISEDVDPLELAVTVFKCERCRSSCWSSTTDVAHHYPNLLAHNCACRYNRDYAKQEEDARVRRAVAWLSRASDTKRATAYALKDAPPRTKIRVTSGIWKANDGVVRMRYIVAALGLDPTRAKRSDLEKCDARLWCRVCSPMTMDVHTWEAAFFHSHKGSGVDHDFWERVREEDMTIVRELEAKAGTLLREKAHWGCTLCRDWDGAGHEIECHLREKHQLGDFGACVEDGTVYWHLGQPHRSTPGTVCLPKPPTGSSPPAASAPALTAV
ncbi:hypothetical protein GSI_12720 [Ganoderma sinense ZZ0214-1]|uniref:F-box domain-containing protein n=1 Tax=Ganoderma sinense ZZ0214-1 TaxID=1077348 RepID=A0A2G8RTM6_9APHY|nr:hypothetical protein GSI_12720 [Ganoderma sinense ZZ0214-1]